MSEKSYRACFHVWHVAKTQYNQANFEKNVLKLLVYVWKIEDLASVKRIP